MAPGGRQLPVAQSVGPLQTRPAAQSARVTQGPPSGSSDQQPPSEGGGTQAEPLLPPELEPPLVGLVEPVEPLLLLPVELLLVLPVEPLLLLPLLPVEPPLVVAPLELGPLEVERDEPRPLLRLVLPELAPCCNVEVDAGQPARMASSALTRPRPVVFTRAVDAR